MLIPAYSSDEGGRLALSVSRNTILALICSTIPRVANDSCFLSFLGNRLLLVGFLLLVVRPGSTSSFLFLVVRPGTNSSVLATSSDALCS